MRIFIILFSLVLFLPGPLWAQTSVGIVNVQELITESTAAQDIQRQIKLEREILEKSFIAFERSLRDEEQKIISQRDVVSPEEFAELRRGFEQKIAQKRAEADNAKQEFDMAIAKASGQLRTNIFKIVADVADEQGFDLVLSRQNVVIAAKSIDVTDVVMQRLNETVKSIKVEK